MKKHLFFRTIYVFMFLLISFGVTVATAEEPGNNPMAVSPGSETVVLTVWQNCPTFSWSSVDQAVSYRLAIFASATGEIIPYENMAIITSPVINKQIDGPALSYTLAEEERLKTGNTYAWYIQAVDDSGNAVGPWSGGKIFKVEQENRFTGIREKLGEILKANGLNDETTAGVLDDLKSEVQEVIVNAPGISRIKGTEAADNTFFGNGAGASNSTGLYNTFVGAGAGYSNTSGNDNTFFGYYAGYANTGSSNTFIGKEAGLSNTSGSDNTFVGAEAGESNTTGNYNTFTGFQAGFSNTSGNRNSFFGYGTGYSATGSYNTFAGYYCGYSTTGSYNTFFGSNAGYTNTSGYNNVFIGDSAGYSNTTSHDNVFFGKSAGYNNTTGYNNTFIGSSAGYTNTTGNANVFLGYNAGYSETNSNKLYIANSNTATPLIYGEFDTGKLIINGNLGIGAGVSHNSKINILTTDEDANLVVTHTNGAQSIISATSSYVQFGSKSNHPVRLFANNSPEMTINTDGSITMDSGASCTTGGVWTDASSRTLKENIEDLSIQEALTALFQLNPVKYNYKADKTDKHVGFIAEDVPELVATADRKGLSPMDITAVLTKVVQELKKKNKACKEIIAALQERVSTLENK